MLVSYIFWDPSRNAFTIPFLNHPIVWYSLFFAAGFFGSYLIAARLLYSYLKSLRPDAKKVAVSFLDHLAWYVFVGMILGARLGHVFFYEWPYYSNHLVNILYTWEGGLSSHGGTLGVLIGLLVFWSKPKNRLPELSLKKLTDILCISAAFVAGAIRLGNFFNQEILGKQTDLPFGVWFGHPADSGALMPCHPVQLYESIFYFILAGILYTLLPKLKEGKVAGLFFILAFTFRFFIEYLKLPQSVYDNPFINMGQLLSLPFIALGIYLYNKKSKPLAK
ncbi:MAG: prolipoprotein diacylglyceryl transferase [Chlamydiales bacterium]|nr:prolipoprotein diacylglyceryl transferase [Chlamydiales bacterium]